MNEFYEELKSLMQKYGIVTLTYTTDDDGLHAYGPGLHWHLGWPTATLKENKPVVDPHFA